MKQLHSLSQHFRLIPKRAVFAAAPGEEKAVNLAEAQLRPDQVTLLSTESKRVREAVGHLLGQNLTGTEQTEIKPKEFSVVALSRTHIRAAVIKDGMVLVQSEEGIQGYIIDEEKGLKAKPGSIDLSAEVSAETFQETNGKPVEVLPHVPALRSRQVFESLGKWETPTKSRIIHPAKSIKLEPRLLNGEDGAAQHEIKLHSPILDIPMTLHALPRGEFLKSWSINMKPSLHGSFVEMSLKSSPDENASDGNNQTTFAFFVDGQGNLVHLEPSPDKSFLQYSVEGLELISLGNTLVIKKEKELEVVNIPAIDGFPCLGKMKEQVTIGNTLYVSFAGSGSSTSGQFVLAINRSTGKIDKTKGKFGIFAGEAVLIDSAKNQIIVLADGKQAKKNVKKMAIYDVTEVKSEKKFQALTPAGAKEVLETVTRFGVLLDGEITPKNLDQVVASMRQLVGDIGFATSDQRVGQFEALIASGIRTLEGLKTEAVREETIRRAEIAKLKEIEDEFDRAIMSLPVEHGDHLGTMVRRLREYLQARTTFVSKRSQLHHIPADRFAKSEQMLQDEDRSKVEDRQMITESIPGHIASLQTLGEQILTELKTASGDEGYKQVGKAKEDFERRWEPLYKILKEIQRNPEVFLSEENGTVKSALDETTVRGRDAVNPEALQGLRLAQIEHAYGEFYARAVRQHVDPEKAEVFERQVSIIRGHAERLYEEASAGDVDQRLGRLQQDLLQLEQGAYTEGALMHSPKHRQLLDGTREQLQVIAESAKETLLRLQDREKKTLLRLIQDKTNKLTAQISWAAQRQESEAGLSPDDQSRNAWNRVQMLVMGYDLITGKARPGLPESAYSPVLKELDELIGRFAKKYSDQETAQGVWRDVRNALAAASNRIEADKGYAHQEGYYTFVLPECYQGRLDTRIDSVQLPLSGKDEVQPLRLVTDVDASGRWPVLKMSVLGNDQFERTLPLGDELVDVLPALHWGAPQDDQLAKSYEGPEVARESVALSFLLEMIPQRTVTIRSLENLTKKYSGNEEGLREEVSKRLAPLFDQLAEETGLTLSNEERQSVSRTLSDALQNGLQFVKQTKQSAVGEDNRMVADTSKVVELQELLEGATAFRQLYEEDLIRLHQYIRRNEKRVSKQLGLSQQQEAARLPHDFRETGLNIVQMRELMNALHIVSTSPDKQGIVLTGDFGSGKTMLVTALAERKKQRLHAIKGNKFGNLQSIDPYTADETNRDQLFLLAGTLTNMKGVITLLDEMQFLPADVLNSLFDTLDVRGELNVTMALDPKESPQDIDVYKDVNKTVKGNTFIMTGNLSFTKESKHTGRLEVMNFILPEALSRRVVKLSTDDIEEQNEFLWMASYIERGSADLGIHPDDVKYLISRRLKHRHFGTAMPVSATDGNLKTDFSTDPERLQEIIKAIDYRCLAATTLVEIQKASRKTRQHGSDMTKLGVPPCWMTAVGGGNVKTLMPLLNHTVRTEQEARAIIREQLLSNADDRGPEHKEENKLFLEHITGSWVDYTEADWKDAVEKAKRLKDEGESAHPYTGPIRAIRGGLDQLSQTFATAQGASGASQEKLSAALQTQSGLLQQLVENLDKNLTPDQQVRTQILQALSNLGEQNKAYQQRLETIHSESVAERKAFEQLLLTQGLAINEFFRKFVEAMSGAAVKKTEELPAEDVDTGTSSSGGVDYLTDFN